MILTVEQINLIKRVIEEEVSIQYGSVSNYIPEQLVLGFIGNRLDLGDYEEALLRFVVTGDENGKLPSEQLRDKIILTKLKTDDDLDIKRNNIGSILLKIDTNPNLVIKTDVEKIKLSKLRYVYNLNFSELLNTRSSLEDLIAQLKQEIADLKSRLRQSENQNENLRFAIRELESQITDLNSLIVELETRVADLQEQILEMSEEHRKEIEQILNDAKIQLDALRTEKDNLEKQKNEEIDSLKAKIDNFINLENLERDRTVVEDVYRYWIDVDREEAKLRKEEIVYDLSDDLQYGAYIVDSTEPIYISDLATEALSTAIKSGDVEATNTSFQYSVRNISQDKNMLLNMSDSKKPLFATVQVYLRTGSGLARLTNESTLMIDLINENKLTQDQKQRLLEFSKRKATLLR